jgi:hypothetical protein
MLEGIMKTSVGVSQSDGSANVANNGMQSHCATQAYKTKKYLLMMSDLNFHWLLVHFVLSCSLGVLLMKPVVLVLVGLCYHFRPVLYRRTRTFAASTQRRPEENAYCTRKCG